MDFLIKKMDNVFISYLFKGCCKSGLMCRADTWIARSANRLLQHPLLITLYSIHTD